MQVSKKHKNSDSNMLVAQEREHILSSQSDFFIREAYNTLRSNVTFSLTGKGCKIVAVTSTNPGEGKSITAMNLAVSYAEINKNVLLVDCDLRKPKIHRLLDIKPTPGLSNVLISQNNPEETVQKIERLGIDVIASGDIPPNSTQLLESEQLEELFAYASDRYDYVILDTPPINVVIDACILAKHTSGIVYVIKQDFAKKDSIINAVKQLEFSQGKIIGFVLNDITDRGFLNIAYGSKYKKYRYGKYKYKYGRYSSYYSHYYGAYGERAENEEYKESLRKQRKKKKGKRLKITLLVILAVLAVGIAVTAKLQENNLQALSYAGKYTGEELQEKNEELDGKIQQVAEKIPNVYIQPLTWEERKMLGSGELTAEQAMAIITGTMPESSPDEAEIAENIPEIAENPETPSGEEADETMNETTNDEAEIQVKTVSRTNEIIAEFYLLKAEFLNKIDDLIAQGQAERLAIPKEERTMTVKLNMAKKYLKLGTELESQCDKQMKELLGELENELKNSEQDTSIVSEIRELYNEEKALKKASLIDSYYPKG